jgi:hypothetical protein
MRKCIIHAGTHKTGTTSIQSALSLRLANRSSVGFAYPRVDGQAAHHNIALGMFDPTRLSAYGGAGVDDLLRLMRDSSGDVVLSSEEFIHAIHYAPIEFQRFLDHMRPMFSKLVIVVYLRNQADYLQSAYFERLKAGMSADFQGYAAARSNANLGEFPLDYGMLTDELTALKGVEIVIRDYSASDVVKDFFNLCGIEIESTTALERKNDRDDFKRCLMQFYENIYRRRASAVESSIIDSIAEFYKDTTPRLSSLCRLAIVSRFAEGNRRVSAAFNLEGLDCGSSDVQYSANRIFANEPSLIDPVDVDMRSAYIDHIFSAGFAGVISSSAAVTSARRGSRWGGPRW